MDTPIAVTIPDAVRLSGCSRSALYEALKRGDLTARKAGRRTLISFSDLEAYLASLPTYQAGASAMTSQMENAGRQPGVLCNQLGGWLHSRSTASDWQAQTLSSRFCLSPWMARDMARLCFGEGHSND